MFFRLGVNFMKRILGYLQKSPTSLAVLVLACVVIHDHRVPQGPAAPKSPVNGRALGRSFAPMVASSLGDGWLAAAEALEQGRDISDAQAALQAAWRDSRTRAFSAKVAPEFIKVQPEGTEPTDPAPTGRPRQALARLRRRPERGPVMDFEDLEGWFHDPEEVDRQLATLSRPLFFQAAPLLSGSGTGKTTLLYKAFKTVNKGSYLDYPRAGHRRLREPRIRPRDRPARSRADRDRPQG